MTEMRELIDTELDVVCGGQHGHHGRAELPDPALGQNFTPYGPYGHRGHENFTPYGHHAHHGGDFDFGNIGDFNFGNINNSGNIVIEENIALQVGVAVGSNASVTNLLGAQLNSSAISRLS